MREIIISRNLYLTLELWFTNDEEKQNSFITDIQTVFQAGSNEAPRNRGGHEP